MAGPRWAAAPQIYILRNLLLSFSGQSNLFIRLTLKSEAERSSETSVHVTKQHGVISHQTPIFNYKIGEILKLRPYFTTTKQQNLNKIINFKNKQLSFE